MTFDIDAWARSPAGRRFHYFDPYLTYVDPDNYGFIAPMGKPTQELNCDTEALFRLGKQAFNRLVHEGECLREEFYEGYAGYWKMIDESRENLAVMFDEGRLRPIGDITRKPILLDFKQADDNQVVSLCWQLYSAPWCNGAATEDVKNVFLQLFLFHTLREIDNALIGVALDGGGVVAAIYAADALSNAIAIESGDEQLTKARKHFAYQAAIEKLKRDPRQNEKTFVYECWRDWQKKPNSYKGKAAFARDMLTKCEHLKSQKKIEDWCREWGSGTLPAE